MLGTVRIPAVLLGRGDQSGFASALSGTEPYGAVID
jgi:hypothetical protein